MGNHYTKRLTALQHTSLNALHEKLNHWRQHRLSSEPIPEEYRQEVVALHVGGVGTGYFQPLGISTRQIRQWLVKNNKNKGESLLEQPKMNFARAEPAVKKNSTTVSQLQSLQSETVESTNEVAITMKHFDTKISVTCHNSDTAKAMLQICWNIAHATINTPS